MKTIALSSLISFFLFSASAQKKEPLYNYGSEVKLCDSGQIIIVPFDSSATVSGFLSPNGFAGHVWFEIDGDTARYGKRPFDWKDGTINMTCKIKGLDCNKNYTLRFVAKTKTGITKTATRNFNTTKCPEPVAKKEMKREKKRKK